MLKHFLHPEEDLLKEFISKEGPIIERMLIELPKSLGLGSFLDWSEDKKDEFINRLTKAKKSIENYSRIPGESPFPPKDKEKQFLNELKELLGTLRLKYELSSEKVKKLLVKISKEY